MYATKHEQTSAEVATIAVLLKGGARNTKRGRVGVVGRHSVAQAAPDRPRGHLCKRPGVLLAHVYLLEAQRRIRARPEKMISKTVLFLSADDENIYSCADKPFCCREKH